VEAVVINDDVAVQDSLYTAGRRGVGTTVLAEKICGAAAEAHRSLKDVAELCRRVNANGRSMGMALTSCTVPAAGKPTFELGEQEMEIGIGIHGEPGRERRALASADEVVEMLTRPIVEVEKLAAEVAELVRSGADATAKIAELMAAAHPQPAQLAPQPLTDAEIEAIVASRMVELRRRGPYGPRNRMTPTRASEIRSWIERRKWTGRAGQRDRLVALDVLSLAEHMGSDVVPYSPAMAARQGRSADTMPAALASVPLRSAERALPSLIARGFIRRYLRRTADADLSKRRVTLYQVLVYR
jgi:hypothetical protein